MAERRRVPERTFSDLVSLGLSRSHSDSRGCYFFRLQRLEEGWELSADCQIPGRDRRTDLVRMVPDEDVAQLYHILGINSLNYYLERYRPSRRRPAHPEEAACFLSFALADGEKIHEPVRDHIELESFFFDLVCLYQEGLAHRHGENETAR